MVAMIGLDYVIVFLTGGLIGFALAMVLIMSEDNKNNKARILNERIERIEKKVNIK